MPSGRRSPDNGQSCSVEKLVIRRGNSDCSGGFCFLPDEIVVGPGKYNLPVLITLDVLVGFLADFARHSTGQNQASRIFQKPGPGLGVEAVPLVLEAHTPAHPSIPACLEVNSVPDYACGQAVDSAFAPPLSASQWSPSLAMGLALNPMSDRRNFRPGVGGVSARRGGNRRAGLPIPAFLKFFGGQFEPCLGGKRGVRGVQVPV